MIKIEDIEKSIIKKFRKEIFRKFVKAINDFDLIKDGDKIAVCISGGKDSFLLAKCMQELKKHNKKQFELCFILMNPGYSKENFQKILNISKHLNIDLNIFDSNIFDIISKTNTNKCYLCARMRRGAPSLTVHI